MLERRHPLLASSPGTTRELLSLHYGPAETGRKCMIQASLHADEVPGLLVAHHLRRQLAQLEAAGALRGEIVLVPFANPIGLAQRMMQAHLGRFDFASGHNFNRHYADLVPRACELLEPGLESGTPSVAMVRDALRRACVEVPVESELDSLRRLLLGLAVDADVVLDLHCDNEAVLHLYTSTPSWPDVEPLARLLGARAVLTTVMSGDDPFDEACSMVWPRIAEQLSRRLGRPVSLPNACVAVTVELRGESDVRHDLAETDARRLIEFLACRGLVAGAPQQLPPLLCAPTPLEGSIPVVAPHGGVVVYLQELGAVVSRGAPLVEIVNPQTGDSSTLSSPTDGVFYARESRRYALTGIRVAKVAGHEPVRSGKLLSD
jgi:predicted deacylase